MTHELNKSYLEKNGWTQVDGGWKPTPLVEDKDHIPISLELAVLITNHIEEEENA